MGCFNSIGFYSHLPIMAGDDVVAFICASKIENIITTDNIVDIDCYFSPITFPIFGKYNDYGCVEDIIRDDNVNIIENIIKCPIEEFLQVIDDVSVGREDEGNEDYTSFIKKIGLDAERYKISFILERYDVFNVMTGDIGEETMYSTNNFLIPKIGDFWLSKLGFICINKEKNQEPKLTKEELDMSVDEFIDYTVNKYATQHQAMLDDKIWYHPDNKDYHIISNKWSTKIVDINNNEITKLYGNIKCFIEKWKEITNHDLIVEEDLKKSKYTELCFDYTKDLCSEIVDEYPLFFSSERLNFNKKISSSKICDDLTTIFDCYGVLKGMQYSKTLFLYRDINIFNFDLKNQVCNFIRFCKNLRDLHGYFIPHCYGGQTTNWKLLNSISKLGVIQSITNMTKLQDE